MLNGKICFIADASEKTGQSVGFALGKQGAKLVLCLPQNKKPDELFLNRLNDANISYMFVNANLENINEAENAVSLVKAEKSFGRIDALFYNIRPDIIKCRMTEINSEQLSCLINDYICKVFVTTKIIGSAISENGAGSIVFLSSVNAEKPTGMFGLWSIYFGALKNLSREAALYFGVKGVRSNCIELGPMGGEDISFKNDLSRFYQGYMYKIPSGYIGTLSDLASLTAYLLSDSNKYINGAEIRMDGGLLLQYIDVVSNANACMRNNGGKE